MHAAISLRVLGAIRLMADATLGVATSRLVVMNGSRRVVEWGQPFEGIAMRAEIQFP